MATILSSCNDMCGEQRLSGQRDFVVPSPLQPGDCVALLCPASYVTDKKMVEVTDSVIKSWGYCTVLSEYIYENHHVFAGTVEQRREELLKFLRDPEVKCLFSIRGGWGSMMQTMQIPLEEIRNNPKWLVGFSDITAMHAAWFTAGVVSVHGPMGGQLMEQGAQDLSSLRLRDMLAGAQPAYELVTRVDNVAPLNRPGHACGRLVGGNIETMMPYLNTRWDVLTQGEDVILFLEDVEENIDHIQRRIIYMHMHGLFKNVKAILFGHFTDYTPDTYESMEHMLDDLVAGLGIPVAYGFPVGHQLPNLPLLHGASVEVNVTATSVTLQYK